MNPTPPPTEPREMTALTDVQLIDWLELHSGTRYKDAARRLRARSELAPQLERLSKERDEEKVRADFADLAADNRGRVIESLEHQLSAANERMARLEDGLTKIFGWWDLHDGHLLTHFNTPVTKEMETIRATLASTNNGRASEGK